MTCPHGWSMRCWLQRSENWPCLNNTMLYVDFSWSDDCRSRCAIHCISIFVLFNGEKIFVMESWMILKCEGGGIQLLNKIIYYHYCFLLYVVCSRILNFDSHRTLEYTLGNKIYVNNHCIAGHIFNWIFVNVLFRFHWNSTGICCEGFSWR